MIEEQLRAMTDEQIRARFRHAPAYYLQSKLEKKRALERRDRREAACARFPGEPAVAEPASLDVALPGLEILDAALTASDYLDSAEADTAVELSGQAMRELEAALDDYANWPLLDDTGPALKAEPATEPGLEFALGLDRGAEQELDLVLEPEPVTAPSGATALDLLLEPDPEQEQATRSELDLLLEPEAEPTSEPESEPDLERRLEQVLESEPDLELVLESEPELEYELEAEPDASAKSEPDAIPDNVTVGAFGSRAPRTVRVVSVVMDRKRPYMVRVVGETTRLAS